MSEQENEISVLRTRCMELYNIVHAQSIAIKSFTDLLNGLAIESKQVQTIFDNEVYSQIIRFDGGIILLK